MRARKVPQRRASDLLVKSLAEPRTLLEVTLAEWDLMLPMARSLSLFSRLAAFSLGSEFADHLPEQVTRHMEASLRFADFRQRKILWELECLARVLRDATYPVVLLKGTGYALGVPEVARGRVFGDVDLLVPKSHLAEIEGRLRDAGWISETLHSHDERYYREWMHEIPPLRHPERRVEVDIHHSIVPQTSRLRVDVSPIFAAAQPVPGRPFLVPSLPDMVLHSAVHLFYGGEFDHGLRDLSDIHLLLQVGSRTTPEFWPELVTRAEILGLGRPLFYALQQVENFFALPAPKHMRTRIAAHGPPWPAAESLDKLLKSALEPVAPGTTTVWAATARTLLWLRSHVLKMPLGILVYHLMRKLGRSKAPQAS